MATPDNANPIIHSTTARSTLSRQDGGLSWTLSKEQDAVWERSGRSKRSETVASGRESNAQGDGEGEDDADGDEHELIDRDEIFDLIRSISDPEHPLSLEQLAVVSAAQVTVSHSTPNPNGGKATGRDHVLVEFTPTIPHCSMATLIGLSLRVRLLRSLPERYKVDIKVKEGTHQSENAVNKQLNDKERVAAALENTHLVAVVQQCLSTA